MILKPVPHLVSEAFVGLDPKAWHTSVFKHQSLSPAWILFLFAVPTLHSVQPHLSGGLHYNHQVAPPPMVSATTQPTKPPCSGPTRIW